MNKAESKRKCFNKRDELLIFLLSTAFGFTVFFFSPFDIFTDNPTAFSVGLKYVAFTMLISSALITLLTVGLLNLLLFFSKEAFSVIVRLLFGVLLAFCTQKLFFNGRMPVLHREDARYERYLPEIAVNTVVFTIILLLPLVLYILRKLMPQNRFFVFGKDWFMPCASAVIFTVQLASAVISVSGAADEDESLYRQYLSYKPVMSLSQEGNIVVFLSDRLDGIWMDEMLEKYPELNESFSGFTFYRNNVSQGTSTFPAVPQMLTGKTYDDSEWHDYLSEAWSGDTLTSRLKKNGYNINILPDCITTVSSTAQLAGQCDNILTLDESEVSVNYFGKKGIFSMMSRLSLAELLPYQFKPSVLYWVGANFSRGFVNYSASVSDNMRYAVGIESDIQFYDCLNRYGLNSGSENKTFSFIHLNGAHTPTAEIASLYDPTAEPDLYATLRGDFEILSEYFRQMKELGIYDNSTIIVLGDHGRVPRELEGAQTRLDGAITSALLIKPAHTDSEKLRTDSRSELSTQFFAASVLEYAGIDHSDFGYSYNDIIKNNLSPERYMQTFHFCGYGRMAYQSEYKITGNAMDFNNWELVDCEE